MKAEQPDPAAILGAALSLHSACLKRAQQDPDLNFSDACHGGDGFLREVMRVATRFEEWACDRVVFQQMDDVWPYLLEDRFGDACLQVRSPDALARLDARDCLRVALKLRLPLRRDVGLLLPVDVCTLNPVAGSPFTGFRIRSVREDRSNGNAVPFTVDDDPFDCRFGEPYFGLHGLLRDGAMEHIAYRADYAALVRLARGLVPGIALPDEPGWDTGGTDFHGRGGSGLTGGWRVWRGHGTVRGCRARSAS